jgi:hypothetical protein
MKFAMALTPDPLDRDRARGLVQGAAFVPLGRGEIRELLKQLKL